MKKLTLALLSVLAFGSAVAAQDSVTVYGRIDLGVGISRINDGFGSKENNAQMVTGAGTSNRIGIKGEEDLGSGYKIKFVLENGFDADTGAEQPKDSPSAVKQLFRLSLHSVHWRPGALQSSAPTAEASICWVTSTRSEQVFGSSATKTSSTARCLPPVLTTPLLTVLRNTEDFS